IISTGYSITEKVLCYFLIALINLLLRLSALEFCSETTAQIAAGIQPIKVICKIRHNSAVRIFPLRTKEIHGKNMAIKVMLLRFYNVS
ncbi:hypothetical protein, partial [Flavobacterium aquidurense]